MTMPRTAEGAVYRGMDKGEAGERGGGKPRHDQAQP
jgi:hypothetical protein